MHEGIRNLIDEMLNPIPENRIKIKEVIKSIIHLASQVNIDLIQKVESGKTDAKTNAIAFEKSQVDLAKLRQAFKDIEPSPMKMYPDVDEKVR